MGGNGGYRSQRKRDDLGGRKDRGRSALRTWLNSVSVGPQALTRHHNPRPGHRSHTHSLLTLNPQVLLLVSLACQFPSPGPGFEGLLVSPPLLVSVISLFFLLFQ